MTFKRALCATTLAAGVGLCRVVRHGSRYGSRRSRAAVQCAEQAALRAGPAHNLAGPATDQRAGTTTTTNGQTVDLRLDNWHDRGVDQGRQDHQPFNWNGQQVTPMPAGNGAGRGFWFSSGCGFRCKATHSRRRVTFAVARRFGFYPAR